MVGDLPEDRFRDILRFLSYYSSYKITDEDHEDTTKSEGSGRAKPNKVHEGLSDKIDIAEKELHEKSHDEHAKKDNEEDKNLKKAIFSDPTAFSDTNLNDIIDAFAKIGFKNGSFVNQFQNGDLTNLLILFNKWINLDPGVPSAENVFENMPAAEEVLAPRTLPIDAFRSTYMAFNFIPLDVYQGPGMRNLYMGNALSPGMNTSSAGNPYEPGSSSPGGAYKTDGQKKREEKGDGWLGY
ncbi:MAG: hypothetical protein KKF44_00815 [Nanoarchaeota archaeon]|nr:hypothetical protein [Nanoarchaeota archaeon]